MVSGLPAHAKGVKDCSHSFADYGEARFESHPGCEHPRIMRCRLCRARVLGRCRSTRASRCVPCAESYRRRVREVAISGLVVAGRGEQALLTLTAPGTQAHTDARTGELCPCTPVGGVHPGIWNAKLPVRWNRFAQALRRLHGFKLVYFRAIETQSRGALHEHVLLVSPDPSRKLILDARKIRRLAIRFGYGHAIRLDKVSFVGGAAGYVAKYVSKAADQRGLVPWINESTGEFCRAAYRTWSSSRGWGRRMGEVVADQYRWARAQRAPCLDPNTKTYTSKDDAMHAAIAALKAGGLLDDAGGT